MSETVPYVVGQWVRGQSFYGRQAELARLLTGRERCTWLAGLRRIGKTSLLRQLELLAGEAGRLPLYWDLQGVADGGELGIAFADALLDAEPLLARHGITPAAVEDRHLPATLARLLRALAARGVALLLLCDEADELLRLAVASPRLVAELGETLLASPDAVAVLACSLRGLTDPPATAGRSGLFAARETPLLLGVLADAEACELVRQSQLPAASRPPCDAATVEAIRDHCGNHPLLLQLVARRRLELGDTGEALRQVAADRTLAHLFAVDLDLLRADERASLSAAARDDGAGSDAKAVDPSRRRLFELGLLRRREGGRVAVANRFLAEWLRERGGS